MLRALLLICFTCLTACSPPEDSPPVAAQTAVVEVSATTENRKPDEQRTITIAADPWCPHNCTAGAQREGYMIEIAREAFALARLEVEYINVSWARALELADEGYIDAVVGAFTRDSTGFVYPEEAIGYARTALFTHIESDWTYQGIESLRQQTLVTINGYSYSSELDAYIDKHKDNPERVWILSGPSPLDRAIEMLEHDRSDVLPEDLDVMQWTLRQLGKQDSLRMVAKLERLPVYVAFSEVHPQSEELATLLTEGVRKLRQSGRLDEILARYNVSWSD
jgi:polar amino acid transport system substrate-binding protein